MLNLKSYLILYLLFCNIGIKIINSKKEFLKKIGRTDSEVKISKKEKIEAFFRGFVISALSRIARGQVTDKSKADKSFDENIREASSIVITYCVPEFFNEYDAVIEKNKHKKGYSEEYLNKIFLTVEIDEIMPVCQKKESIDKLDGNEYSTLNVIGGWIKDVFTKNPYYVDYKKFKEEKEKILSQVKELTSKYTNVFSYRKNNLEDKTAKKIAEEIYSALNASFFGKKDICEVLQQFYQVDFFDQLEGLMVGSMKGLVCGSKEFINYFPNIALEELFKNVFENFGLSIGKGILATVFPPALAGYVLGFLWSNFFQLTKLAKYAVVSTSDSEEKDLYQTIGGIAGNEFVGLVI